MKYRPIHHQAQAYRLAVDTDVRDTWRRFGFKPTTPAQRLAQQQQPATAPAPAQPVRKRRRTSAPTPLRAVGGSGR